MTLTEKKQAAKRLIELRGKASKDFTTFHPKLRFCANDISATDCCDEEPYVVAQMNRNMPKWKDDAEFLCHSANHAAQLAGDFLSAIEWIEGADCTCDAETGSERSYEKCECFRCDFLEKLEAG